MPQDKKAPPVYSKTETTGVCVYEIWDRQLRRLVPCGKPGHRWVSGGSTYGVNLCDEHGEFYADAKAFQRPSRGNVS